MPKLSELVKLVKPFAKNPSISDEDLLNAILLPFVIAGNIKNKNNDEHYLDKSRTSRIMNQKEEVPNKLKKALEIYGIRDRTEAEMQSFIEGYLDNNTSRNLIQILLKTMNQTQQEVGNAEGINILSALLTDMLIGSLSESNLSVPIIDTIWKHGANSIDVQTGDLFHYGFDNRHKKKNIVVIPVNTAFDTHVTTLIERNPYPLVSENTIHGQWINRMKASGVQPDVVDDRICESLKKHGFYPVGESKHRNGKSDCYPIGATAIIETDNAIYFLVAIAHFDCNNNARSSYKDIDVALQSLLELYDRVGMGYDIYLPLMGTGLSRADLSIPEAYKLMTETLIRNCKRIHGHIHIILKAEDRSEL